MTSDAAVSAKATGDKQRLMTLAESVSFAVVVDRPLLRAARLKFVPDADASLEADFWFAPLIRTRAADGVTLLPDAADELRRNVAKDPQRLQDVWKLTSEMHAHLPATLKLEEEIAYLSVSSGEPAVQRIEMLLRSALAAMVDGGRDQLANWSARLLANLPTTVRLLPAARLLDAGARLRLGGDASQVESDDPELVSWLTPSTLPRDQIGVRFTATGLTFDASPEPRGEMMAVPRTRPLLLRASWTSPDGESQSAQVTIRRGEQANLDVSANEVGVTTLTGESYSLRRSGSTPESVASAIIDFRELIARKAGVEILGREQALDEIHALIDSRVRHPRVARGSIVMVTGAPGSGKTTLLARLTEDLNASRTPCFTHFFEPGTPRLEDYELARRSLMAQMISHFDLPASMLSMPLDAFIQAVPRRFLAEVPIVIILDNVDGVRGTDALEIVRPLRNLLAPFCMIASARQSPKLVSIDSIHTDATDVAEFARELYRFNMPPGTFGDLDVIVAAQTQYSNGRIESLSDVLENEGTMSEGMPLLLATLAAARAPLPFKDATTLANLHNFENVPDSSFINSYQHEGEISLAIANGAAADFLRKIASPDNAQADLALAVAPRAAPAEQFSWYGLTHGPFHWQQAGRVDLALQQLGRADLLRRRIAMYGARITSNYIEEIVLNNTKAHMHGAAVLQLVVVMRTMATRLDAAPEELVPLLYPALRDAGFDDADISRLFSIEDEALPTLRIVRRERGKGSGYRLPARVTRLRAFPKRTFLAALEDHSLLLFRPFDDLSSPLLLGSHPEWITAITGGIDWAVSGSADGLLSFWNLGRPHLKFQSTAHQAGIVELLAGKDRCFSCDAEGTIIAWRIKRGKADQADRWEKLWTRSLDSCVTVAAFSVASELIVAGCRDGSITTFDSDGEVMSRTAPRQGPVVAIAAYRNFVISAGSDRMLRVSRAASSELVAEVQTGHAMGIAGIAVSQLGTMIATWSADRTARVFSTSVTKPLTPLAVVSPHRAAITSAAFVSNDALLTCSADGTAVVSRRDGTEVFRFEEHDAPIRACTVAWPVKMHAIVITASDDRRILVWRGRNGEITSEPSPAVTRIAGVLGGGTLIRRGQDVEIRTRSSKRTVKAADFAVSPDGEEFAVAQQRHLSVYRASVGLFAPGLVFSLREPIREFVIANVIVSAVGTSGTIAIFNRRFTRGLINPAQSRPFVRTTAMQPIEDLGAAVTGGIDGSIWRWDAFSAPPLRYGSHESRVTSLAVFNAATVSAADDGSLILWTPEGREAARGKTDVVRVRHILIHHGFVFCAGDDGAIESFTYAGLNRVARLEAHRDAVTGMCIDSHRDLLFTASADATIRAWKGERPIATYYGDVPFTALALVDGEIVAGDQAGGLLWLSFGPPPVAAPKKAARKRASSGALKKPARKRVMSAAPKIKAKQLMAAAPRIKAPARSSGDALKSTLRPKSSRKSLRSLGKKI